ncbi:MAG: hypothetical protein UHM08_02830 [Bacteroidales bacterium]|nr:hypothetical protein [Bacteroidales bacterium]
MLFEEIVFGPIKSRRLGVSLGVNVLPTEKNIVVLTASIVNVVGIK